MKKQLPQVVILPLSSYFMTKISTKKLVIEKDHQHGRMALKFLQYYYEKTIPLSNRTSYSDTYYFVPATQGDNSANHRPPEEYWLKLDKEIQSIADRMSTGGIPLILDHTFIGMSTPRGTRDLHDTKPETRNVVDLRCLRVDGELGVNHREIFVPYIVDRREFELQYNWSTTAREKFVGAPCSPPKVKCADMLRGWREKLYKAWSNVPNSTVTMDRLSPEAFHRLYTHSDFCAIIPGDTSATSKLYKSIFSGCIPVIFVSAPAILPFADLVNWSSFAIIAFKDDIYSQSRMNSLINTLKGIRGNPSKLAGYKKNLLAAADLFDYSKADFPSPHHLTLLQLVYENKRYEKMLV